MEERHQPMNARVRSTVSQCALLRLLVAPLLLVALLAGCGGGGNSATSAATDVEGAENSVATTATTAVTESASAGSLEVPKKTIGLLQLAGQSRAQGQITGEFERAAAALGWKVLVKDAQGDPAKMAAAAQSYAQQNVDAFVGISIPPTAVQAALKQMKSKGIPFVSMGGSVEQTGGFPEAQFRPSEAVTGALMAQYIVDVMDNKGKIAVQHLDSQFGVKVRDNVLESVFRDFGGPEIVAEHQMDVANLVSDTLSSVKDQLQANPDLDALYSSIDSQLGPMVSLAKQLNKPNLRIFAFNTDPDNSKALRENHNAAVVDTPYWYVGWLAADSLAQHWVNEEPISSATQAAKYPIPSIIVTHKNLPDGVENYPFPDIGAKVYADWEAAGFKLNELPTPTVEVAPDSQ